MKSEGTKLRQITQSSKSIIDEIIETHGDSIEINKSKAAEVSKTRDFATEQKQLQISTIKRKE